VTFLSILAHNAIALPLSQAFPSSELRYIIENSEAALLLATAKFKDKAEDVLKGDIQHKPQLEVLDKIDTGATSAENVKFELENSPDDGGFMLYTSGTTSRPVSSESAVWSY
jgi:acyl-CoA synthetase (AMP-forming)/AMP-acid ligase II